MKYYVIDRMDGGVAIMEAKDEASPVDEVAKWHPTMRAELATPMQIIEIGVNDVPFDRSFRSAWRRGGSKVAVDMAKAREVHMDRIRAIRDVELARLDIEQLRGNNPTATKQTLRDIPQNFDLTVATTPDELKALWPAILPRK